jgi:hypothetical protein
MSVFAFLDKMPHDLANKFKDDFVREHEKRKISCTSICNNEMQNFIFDIHKMLIIHARKVIWYCVYIYNI